MNKLLVTTAVAFLTLTGLPATGAQAGLNVRIKLPADFSSVQKAGCYDGECDYEAEERDDDEYGRSGRRNFYPPASRRERPTARAETNRTAKPITVATPEPEPAPKPEPLTATKIGDGENSSIATTDDEVAEPGNTEKKVAAAKDLGCKKFFASAGMTLTVPCE